MCYFRNVFERSQATIDTICHALDDPKFDRVDFLVGIGISGILPLLPVSLKSGIVYGALRKSIEADASNNEGGSHSDSHLESWTPTEHRVNRYVIIDDLIDSGKTIKNIIKTMTAQYAHSRCVGIILYQNFDITEQRPWWGDIPLTCLHNDIFELDRMNHREEVVV